MAVKYSTVIHCNSLKMSDALIWCQTHISPIKTTVAWSDLEVDDPVSTNKMYSGEKLGEYYELLIDKLIENMIKGSYPAVIRIIFDNEDDKMLFDLTWL